MPSENFDACKKFLATFMLETLAVQPLSAVGLQRMQLQGGLNFRSQQELVAERQKNSARLL